MHLVTLNLLCKWVMNVPTDCVQNVAFNPSVTRNLEWSMILSYV